MNPSARGVFFIGGGIVGASVAYFLSKEDAKKEGMEEEVSQQIIKLLAQGGLSPHDL
jgi:hypothetical protein